MKSNLIIELKRIADEHSGLLKPEVVVAEARPKSSPLHSRFEWRDGEAAHRYRIWQARQLIAVTVEMIPGIKGNVDVFVSLSSDRQKDGGGYRVMTRVMTNEEMRRVMFLDAVAELRVFQKKYARLTELASVFRIIKTVVRKRLTRRR